MSKRFYLANVIGTGDEEDQHRPAVAEHPVSWVGGIAVNPQTGQPLKSWTLVMVNTSDHVQLIDDPRIDPLPDFPLDGKVSAINTVAKDTMIAAMTRRGIDIGAIAEADGYREVIQFLGNEANPGFNVNAFDVN